jgi:hypothetical protein
MTGLLETKRLKYCGKIIRILQTKLLGFFDKMVEVSHFRKWQNAVDRIDISRGRLMRRTIARYLIVALIQTLRMTSVQVNITNVLLYDTQDDHRPVIDRLPYVLSSKVSG